MTTYESASLWAQWVGSGAAVAAVLVAIVFGYLTLLNNRRAKDAQQRASLAAASHRAGPHALPGIRDAAGANFSVRHHAGDTWLLTNDGPGIAYAVEIRGFTDLDERRLRDVPTAPFTVRAGEASGFTLVSRYTLAGPANIVVTYRLDPDGAPTTIVLPVPAP
ncbi:hypothetical protein AB3M83_05350 [Microbacterium sp. 179-B 1A2 NHS]|uniref:hypothetical protein n=1 Tax=Microbacterium sp. 179-B 1A2 NHS TaxID=3142383 RepID=UPI0039A2A581